MLTGAIDAHPRRRWALAPLALYVAGVLAASAVFAFTVVVAAGMSLEASGFLRFLVLAAAMGGLACWCRARRLDERFTAAAAIVGVGTLSLMICGIISNAGLRLGAPTIDGWLVAADGAAGIDVGAVVRSFAEHPRAIDLLAFVYNASGALVVVLIAAHLIKGRKAKAWELVATVVAAMQIVAVVSIAVPATGAMTHLGLLSLQGGGLPEGAGVYHLDAFVRFHAGTDPVLRLGEMSGLVTFPSFHTVLALLATQALAETRWRWLGVGWTAAVIVSTIPIGGHYVTDLAAGFAIWAASAAVARRLSIPSA